MRSGLPSVPHLLECVENCPKEGLVFVHVFSFPFSELVVGINIRTSVSASQMFLFKSCFNFTELTSFEGAPAGPAVCF